MTAMNELVSNGLRFGNLMRIDQPNLVERYRRAMDCLGLRPTALAEFHIDASGFSPEVAGELSDQHYMDPLGWNRRIIVLTPEQRKLPLLNVSFSADVELIRRFFIENDRALRTLTLKDVVYGEIENLILEVSSLDDLLHLREVRFDVHTPSRILEEARVLSRRADEFLSAPKAWKSPQAIEAIVEGAKRCGDVRTNGILPTELSFPWPPVFRTSHFGGIYVLRGGMHTTVLAPEGMQGAREGDDVRILSLEDAPAILDELRSGGFVEPLNAEWLRTSGVLEQRLHLLLADILVKAEPEFDPMRIIEDPYSNKWIHARMDILRRDQRFKAITQVRNLVGNGGDVATYEKSLPAELRMMFRRALPEQLGAWDINRVLLRWSRFDFLSLYALDKPAFYDAYAAMDPRLQRFAVQYILRNYHVDSADVWRRKAEFRERIFGIHNI